MSFRKAHCSVGPNALGEFGKGHDEQLTCIGRARARGMLAFSRESSFWWCGPSWTLTGATDLTNAPARALNFIEKFKFSAKSQRAHTHSHLRQRRTNGQSLSATPIYTNDRYKRPHLRSVRLVLDSVRCSICFREILNDFRGGTSRHRFEWESRRRCPLKRLI